MFNDAKKDIFLTEAKTIYKEVSKKYISESMKGNKLSFVSSSNNQKLDISTKEGLEYCINLSNSGNITSMVAVDKNYYIEYDGKSDLNSYTKDNIKEIDNKVKMICSSTMSKIIEEPELKECSYGGKLENNVTYKDDTYTYTYHPWSNGYWEVVLTDKESTTAIDKPFCNMIDGKPIKSVKELFKDSKAVSIDVTKFNTSNVDNMENMFKNTSATEIKGLEYLDTSNVTKMTNMFGNTNVDNLDLSGFDTSKVINMSYMFVNSKATTINVSSFDTSNVTNMYGMFYNTSIKSINISNFNTNNVTTLVGMFRESKIETLDLSSFHTPKVTNMRDMFAGTANLKTLDLSNFDTSNVTNMGTMFSGCAAITIKGLNKFNTSKVTNMYAMLNSTKIKELDLSSFDTSKVTDMGLMFNSSAAEKINLSSFNTSSVKNMAWMFLGAKATKLDLTNFNTSNVTNMQWMFYGAKVKELDLTSFNTSKVTNMGGTFRATRLDLLDISSFDITNADISYMFDGAVVTKVLVKNEEDLEKYKNSGSVLALTKFYVKS